MFGPIFKRRPTTDFDPQQAPQTGAVSRVEPSHVLPRLARRLSLLPHPRVLDMGSVVGGNLQFFIDLGCKITSDDLLKPVEVLRPGTSATGIDWKNPSTNRLDHSDGSFEAIIAWDIFDFLPPAEAKTFARDLHRVMKPGGIVLAYFTSRQTERREPHRRYRIQAQDKIEWIPVSNARTLRHVYQNRDIQLMFEGFKTHTAFVLQNGTREMLLEKKLPVAAPAPISTPLPAPAK
jgi:2-polyprenyl-3-methyl-5-hydroxy-6-metoxy-1,4-benzoquinol methylase